MSNTIDNRIVQMDFQNEKFSKGVDNTLKDISSLNKGLNFADSTKGLENIDRAIGKVSFGPMAQALEDIKSRFSIMGIAGITIISNITTKLLQMGEQLVRTFAIDPIASGFSEYELKLNSVQTIMAGTGESLQTVTGYLNELNTYADKTIYSFSDMTTNIGKFTNAGISLDQSVKAIQGVANVAAVSGSNAMEASRAMYNFAQALSAGYVKLIDWKSIELANMGTVEFKQQLIDSAVAIGTLTDAGDGLYSTLEGKTLSATRGFNEALTDQWLSTEVLISTLNRYSDSETEIGKKAIAAAQDVKTFTQLNDTLKEAAQSGWAETWEQIIGNFDEAKVFITELSDLFGGLIGSNADARNAIIKVWKDLGGRTALLDVVRNSLNGILSVIKPVSDAMKEIFPPITGEQLAALSISLKNISEKFKMGAEQADKVKRVFKGFFALLDIGRMFVVSIVKSLFGFSSAIKPITSYVGDLALKLADYIVGLRDTIKRTDAFTGAIRRGVQFIEPYIQMIKDFVLGIIETTKSIKGFDGSKLSEFFKQLGDRFKPLKGVITILGKILALTALTIRKIAPIFSKLGSIIGDSLNVILDKLSDFIGDFDPEKAFAFLNEGLFAALLLGLRTFLNKGSSALDSIADILDGVGDSLKAWQQSLQAKTILNIALAIGVLAVSLLLISSIETGKLLSAIAALTTLFVELFGAMSVFSNSSGGFGLATAAGSLIAISGALLILSGAIFVLAKLNPDELVRSIVGITFLMAAMKKMTNTMSNPGGLISAAISMGIIATSLLIMAQAVKSMGKMDTKTMIQGLLGIAALLAEMTIFMKVAGDSKSMILISVGMLVLANALLALTGAIFLIGSIPLEKLTQGLVGIASALLIIAGAMNLMPPDMLVTSAALLVVSGALVILAIALKTLGGLSWEQLAIGLAAVAGSLLILGVAMSAMTGLIGGAASLIIAAGALAILAVALKTLGDMSLEEIGLSLLAIVGVLTVLGVAASLLTPLIPSLLGLSVALLLIGVASLAAGAGVLALSIGLTAIAAAGAAGVTSLVAIITGIVSLLPLIAKQLGKALISLIGTIAEGAPVLLDAVVKILLMIVDGLVQVIPKAVEAILLLVSKLIDGLVEALPDIIQAGYEILLALLQGIEDNIEDIVIVVIGIVDTFLRIWGQETPTLVDAGYDAIIAFIDGLADSAEENIPRLLESMRHLGKSIVSGVIKGLTEGSGELFAAIFQLGKDVIATFAESVDSNSPSKEFVAQSGYIIAGLVGGLHKFGGKVYSAVTELGDGTKTAFRSTISDLAESINSEMDLNPSIRPVMDLTDVVSGSNKIESIVNGISPSIETGVKQVGAIAALQSKNVVGSELTNSTGEVIPGSNISFTQYNTSPKELSRIDIYRATKNQLRQLKGLAGVK